MTHCSRILDSRVCRYDGLELLIESADDLDLKPKTTAKYLFIINGCLPTHHIYRHALRAGDTLI